MTRQARPGASQRALGALFMLLAAFMGGIGWLGVETGKGAVRWVVGVVGFVLAFWFLDLARRMLKAAIRTRG